MTSPFLHQINEVVFSFFCHETWSALSQKQGQTVKRSEVIDKPGRGRQSKQSKGNKHAKSTISFNYTSSISEDEIIYKNCKSKRWTKS